MILMLFFVFVAFVFVFVLVFKWRFFIRLVKANFHFSGARSCKPGQALRKLFNAIL